MEHPKFIINNGNIVLGHVEFHRDLLRDHQGKTIGGGWWYYERESNTMFLYGTSIEFGAVTEDQAIEAWANSYHIDMKMIFSTEDKLEYVLHPERKPINKKILGIVGNGSVGKSAFINDVIHNQVENKADIYVHGEKIGECSDVRIGDLPIASVMYQGEKMISVSPEHIGIDYGMVKDVAQDMVDSASLNELYALNNHYSVFGTAEKKKKKPCTYHEYVLKGKEEIHPNVYVQIWRCRHCEHPLN